MKPRWERKTGSIYAIGKWYIPLEIAHKHLGDAHFVEADPSRTHSGTEHYWCFEHHENLALVFEFSEPLEELYVGSNQNSKVTNKDIFEYLPLEYEATEGELWD